MPARAAEPTYVVLVTPPYGEGRLTFEQALDATVTLGPFTDQNCAAAAALHGNSIWTEPSGGFTVAKCAPRPHSWQIEDIARMTQVIR